MSVVPPNIYERKRNINFGDLGSALATLVTQDVSETKRQAEATLTRRLRRRTNQLRDRPLGIIRETPPPSPPSRRRTNVRSAYEQLQQGLNKLQHQRGVAQIREQAQARQAAADAASGKRRQQTMRFYRGRRRFRPLRNRRPSVFGARKTFARYKGVNIVRWEVDDGGSGDDSIALSDGALDDVSEDSDADAMDL